MQLSVEVSDAADNDRYLPRQLTVQLLGILARALPTAAATANTNEFVKTFHNQGLFTPLTYAIFWRDGIDNAVKQDAQQIDALDKYNRAPLLCAIANEDFTTAVTLLDKGAKIFLEDKLVLELTLFSMLQRDPQIAAKILAAATPVEQEWLGEYLDYLHSYATTTETKHASRDPIDPPLRHFGQILETTACFNGTPSYYGFLSPSLQVLKKHLDEYKGTEIFKAIRDAFDFTSTACNYHGNLPQGTNPAKVLLEQIQKHIANNSLDPIVLFGGWAGNAVAMAFINKTLILSNLGTASDLQHGTLIYTINKPEHISQEFIHTFINGLGYAANPSDILAAIGKIVDPAPIYKIKQELKPIDNCIFVNPRLIIEGILLVLTVYKANLKLNAENLAKSANQCAISYQESLNDLYKIAASDLALFMRNNELSANQRLECCDLAMAYINQHFKDPGAIARCIELKNALEFVGLKDYYLRKISSEAQKAIQNQMISEQENTAVKVIDLEYELFGKKIDNNPPPQAPDPTPTVEA